MTDTFYSTSDPALIAELAKQTKSELAALYFNNRSGQSSTKWLHYLDTYDRYLSPYRNRPIRFLEIGIADGGSFAVWRPYFGPDAIIYGIDINEACLPKVEKLGLNCHVRIGSQDDAAFLRNVIEDMGGVDIVIDDGSHIAEHQCTTFRILFPLLANGGLYICEDLHTSYWPAWQGGHRRSGTFVELIKDMIDSIHTWYVPLTNDLADMRLHRIVPAIHIHDSMVVIEKMPVEPPTMVTV